MTEMLLYAYDFGQGAAFAWQLYFRTHAVNIIRIGSFQKSLLHGKLSRCNNTMLCMPVWACSLEEHRHTATEVLRLC